MNELKRCQAFPEQSVTKKLLGMTTKGALNLITLYALISPKIVYIVHIYIFSEKYHLFSS